MHVAEVLQHSEMLGEELLQFIVVKEFLLHLLLCFLITVLLLALDLMNIVTIRRLGARLTLAIAIIQTLLRFFL